VSATVASAAKPRLRCVASTVPSGDLPANEGVFTRGTIAANTKRAVIVR
jgi:hypothetical protein